MSGTIEFLYSIRRNNYGPDQAVLSEVVSAGGHDWRVSCFPYNDGDFVSVYLELMSGAKNVKAVFDAAVLIIDRDDVMRRRTVHVYNLPCEDRERRLWGFPRFLHMGAVGDRSGGLQTAVYRRVSITWAVVVVDGDGGGEPIADVPVPPLPTWKGTIAVPPSDMAGHLGRMLDSASLVDVSFVVVEHDGQGQTKTPPIRAHRALLAARSPVFEAALICGSANAPSSDQPITVRDVDPVTFKAMLRFIYTDRLPTGADDDGEAIRSLLAAADRYALDRLKLLCAKRLLDKVSVSTVVGMLECAEAYNCPELKTKCIDYLMDSDNFREVALTDGYMELVARSPSIVAEMRNTLRTLPGPHVV